MADAVYVAAADHFEHLLHVDLRRGEQHFAQQFVRQLGIDLVQIQAVIRKNLTHEAEAVGVHAARGDAHQHIAGPDLRSVDELRFLDHADRETGDVVLALGVHARHFGRLAADQRTTRLAAAVGNATHDGFDLLGFVMAYGDIVEEHQGLGTLRQHVVDAHGHGIDADRVVLVHLERQLELRAHAVGTAHQHRLLHVQRREVEHASECTDIAHHAQARGRCHVFLDAPHHFVSSLEVHTGLLITLCHYNLPFKVVLNILRLCSPHRPTGTTPWDSAP